MNNKFTMIIVWALFLLGLGSCQYDISPATPKILSMPEDTLAKIDTDDKEMASTDDDLACLEDSDCIIVDKGCCIGEKPFALNQNKAKVLVDKRNTECQALKKDKQAALDKELKEKRTAVNEASAKWRKEKDKAAKAEARKEVEKLQNELQEKNKEVRQGLCFGRSRPIETGQTAMCVECKCALGSLETRAPGLGAKCTAARKYLTDSKADIEKSLAESKNSIDKNAVIELWNKLVTMIKNSQECGCEKYQKDLTDSVTKLKG